jgi:hypothetical protein
MADDVPVKKELSDKVKGMKFMKRKEEASIRQKHEEGI